MQIQKVYLAPMEGVCDPPMRKVLCRYGDYDACFSEFIRVTDAVLPSRTFLREVPELAEGAKTPDGTPVRVQLLGDNPDIMARNALRAVSLGATAIDLNFGCPSRFVHHAGSMLLKEPELLHEITSEVREKLPPEVLLSVKLRAGFADKSEAPAIIRAVAVPGLAEICVHARTRKELYRKDALDWSVIAGLHECAPGITLVANGEIVSYATAQECAAKSGCDVLMTGRAALSVPNLGAVIKHQAVPFDSEQMLQVLLELIEEFERCSFAEKSILDRIKQFMGFARLQNAAVGAFFRTFCKVTSLPEALQALKDWPAFIAAQTEISSATSNSVAETVSAPAAAEA